MDNFAQKIVFLLHFVEILGSTVAFKRGTKYKCMHDLFVYIEAVFKIYLVFALGRSAARKNLIKSTLKECK